MMGSTAALLLALACWPAWPAAAQYGASKPAAAPAQTAVQCWPEAETVWDTQYVETESEECSMVMVPQQQCRTVHKRQPKRFSKKVNKMVCNDGSSLGSVVQP